MLTCCNTARGRLACGLGGVLIAALALACLWVFSPAVTAGDDPLPPPLPKLTKDVEKSPVPDLPRAPVTDKSDLDLPPCPPMPPAPVAPTKADHAAPPPPLPPTASPTPPPPPLPPKPDVAPPAPLPPDTKAPPADLPMDTGPAKSAQFAPGPPPSPPAQDPLVTPVVGVSPAPPPTPPKPESAGQDIKQLVAQLSEIRADRTKLDEKERQTIQTIKKKYQDQKQSLRQLERELHKLGINCDEVESVSPPSAH